MKTLRKQSGFTLLEMSVVLAVLSIIMVPIVSIIASQLRVPVKILSELTASQQIQNASVLITDDASVARTFTPETDPNYGTFSSFEFSSKSPIPVNVKYYWSNSQVLRIVDRGGEISPPQVVVSGVTQYGDVNFQYTPSSWTYQPVPKTWAYTQGQVKVLVVTTNEAGAAFPDTVFTARLSANLRPEIDRPVPIPGGLQPPPPPANQVGFRISGNPNLLVGSVVSGSGQSLTYDDSNYYRTRATGSPRTITWEATSEVIDYTTITDITVELTAQVNSTGVTQQLFVYNPTDPAHTNGGYDTSPDQAITYSTSGTDVTIIFTLSADDVAYVNSLGTKVVTIKMSMTSTSPFDHFGDKLVFRVAGQPSATFSRDFLVDTEPSIETGLYVSGDVSSLAVDDTNYYINQESGSIIQWSAVSEAITLDTISSAEVFFTARTTKGAPTQQIFVFNPANGGDGYSATPDSTHTYISINTDATVSFFLKAADLTYINSLFPREVRIRVKGTDSSPQWRLEADRIVFRVKP